MERPSDQATSVPGRAGGNWVVVVLLVGLVAFIVWGVHLFTHPRTPAAEAGLTTADARRAVELITGPSGSYLGPEDTIRESLGALRVLPDEARLEGLLHCLGQPDPVRGKAAYFAGALGERDARLVQPLAAALNGWATDKAAYALARSGHPDAFAALSRAAFEKEHNHAQIAIYATWGLAIWDGPEATDALLQVVALGDPMFGHQAAVALACRADSGAVRPLIQLVKTIQPVKEPSVPGRRAALALGYLRERAALKHLREAAHRVGDWYTGERLTVAFALRRIRKGDDYNFWLLAEGAKKRLPLAPYRPKPPPQDTYATALQLIIQLDDPRVKQVLVDASRNAEGDHASAIVTAFGALGFQPVWDQDQGGYVLRNRPPDRAPSHPPHVIVAPWPFSEALMKSSPPGE